MKKERQRLRPKKEEALIILKQQAERFVPCCFGMIPKVPRYSCSFCFIDRLTNGRYCFGLKKEQQLLGLAFIATMPDSIREQFETEEE